MRRLLFALALSPLLATAARAEAPVTVFAAASLKAAMADVSDAWAARGHPKPIVSLGSSGALAKQIQQGAAATVFISADEKWMDYLDQHKLIVAGSRADLLTNTLVLVAPADTAKPIALKRGFNLAALLGPKGRLAVGDTATVPAGIYAKQALTALGVWDVAKDHLAPTEDVKGALLLVERGETPAGVVYGTDVRGDKKVRVIGVFPPASHDPIIYPIALITNAGDTGTAKSALAFFRSATARAIYRKYGFGTE